MGKHTSYHGELEAADYGVRLEVRHRGCLSRFLEDRVANDAKREDSSPRS